jgi:hypothetical protein
VRVLPQAGHRFSYGFFSLAVAVVVITALMIFAALAEASAANRPLFGMRTLLVAMILLAVALGLAAVAIKQ